MNGQEVLNLSDDTICATIRPLGYASAATIETLERPMPWHNVVETDPSGLVWVESDIMAVHKCKDGWEVIFRKYASSGWYPSTNLRNLKVIQA